MEEARRGAKQETEQPDQSNTINRMVHRVIAQHCSRMNDGANKSGLKPGAPQGRKHVGGVYFVPSPSESPLIPDFFCQRLGSGSKPLLRIPYSSYSPYSASTHGTPLLTVGSTKLPFRAPHHERRVPEAQSLKYAFCTQQCVFYFKLMECGF